MSMDVTVPTWAPEEDQSERSTHMPTFGIFSLISQKAFTVAFAWCSKHHDQDSPLVWKL